jgi:hypothetical protein
MEARALAILARMGDQLDKHVFPGVADGGLVVLNESSVPLNESTERNHGRKEERGSAAGSRSGTTGRERSPGGARPAGDAASVIGAGLQAQYEAQLSALGTHYPGAQFWHQNDGVWLLTPSTLLPELDQSAIFITGISFSVRKVLSWAFWANALAYVQWIGPRHTNFPDGSICAFEPLDGTWEFGDPLVDLLDIYTLWAVRHLHLQQFGRWPGYQSIHFAGERLLELRGDEHCGCANSARLYADCCMPRDMAGNRIAQLLDFHRKTGGTRKPPEPVVKFARSQEHLPDLANLVSVWLEFGEEIGQR